MGVEAMLLLLLPARRLAADSAYASMGAVGLRIRLGRDATVEEIAAALADAIAGAGREG